MATIASPYGMMPTRNKGSQRFPSAGNMFPITKNIAAPIYWHSPVSMIAGGIKALGASPTSTPGANNPVGVLNIAFWEDAAGVHWSPMFPVLTVEGGSPTAWKAFAVVNDDPDYVFRIQATTSLTLADVGKTAPLVNWAAGNAKTGISGAALGAAVATGVEALRIIRVLDVGDPFPDVLVQWNGGIHQYQHASAV